VTDMGVITGVKGLGVTVSLIVLVKSVKSEEGQIS